MLKQSIQYGKIKNGWVGQKKALKIGYPLWMAPNLLVMQVKINRFLHFNECIKSFFCYLVKLFDAKPSNIGHIFTR